MIRIAAPQHGQDRSWTSGSVAEIGSSHASDWILYLDGEEIARVSSGLELEQLVVAHLSPARDGHEIATLPEEAVGRVHDP